MKYVSEKYDAQLTELAATLVTPERFALLRSVQLELPLNVIPFPGPEAA